MSLSITNSRGQLSNGQGHRPGLEGGPPFQKLLVLESGYAAVEIPARTIVERIDLTREFHVTLNPNILHADEEGLTLYFGLVAFDN